MDIQNSEKDETSKRTIFPWYYQKFFKYSVAILLVLTNIIIFYQVAFLLSPIFNFISTLFTPVIASILFYYLLRPLVYGLEEVKIPRYLGILIIYLLGGILLFIFFAYLGPILGKQITAIANTSVETLEKVETTSKSFIFKYFDMNLNQEIEQRLFGFIQQATTLLSKNLIDLVGFITRLATILAVIPFIVFYLLKDDHDLASGFLNYVPTDFGREVRKILRNIDSTLSSYINGLVIVSASVGMMLFVGYLIIGLDYALILSVIAIIFTTVPFVGPFLAIAPALLFGLSESPFMALKVAIVFIIVQQLESNVISPQIIGQRLNIHPVTIILLLL